MANEIDLNISIGPESKRGTVSTSKSVDEGQIVFAYSNFPNTATDGSAFRKTPVTGDTAFSSKDLRLYVDTKAGGSSVVRVPVNAYFADYSNYASRIEIVEDNTNTFKVMGTSGTDTTPRVGSITFKGNQINATTFSGFATSAGMLKDKAGSAGVGLNVGNSTTPVYFSNGIPVEADDYTTLLTNITSTQAKNLEVTVGGTSKSVTDLYATYIEATEASAAKGYLMAKKSDAGTAFTPMYDTGVYLTTTAGQLAVGTLQITSKSGVAHIEFSRTDSYNYQFLKSTSGGKIAFCIGSSVSANGSQLVISTTSLTPGTTDKIHLGTSDNRWASIYAKDAAFDTVSGEGSALTALNASEITSGTLGADRLDTSGVDEGNYGPSANKTFNLSSETFLVPYITVDTKGRITGASSKTMTARLEVRSSDPNTLSAGMMWINTSV